MGIPEGLRPQKEQRIARRLTRSQRVQRGLLGLGVVVGIASGAHEATDGAVGIPWEVGAGVAVAASTTGGTERILARRTASRTVRSYEEETGADPGSHRGGADQSFIDSVYAQDPVRTTYPFLTPVISWAGGYALSVSLANERIAELGEQGLVTTAGISAVATSIVLEEIDRARHQKLQQEVYPRQLNSVDANLASRLDGE